MTPGPARPRGRPHLPRRGLRRRRRDLRRGRLQHRHDRLPGDADRPVLPPAGRRHDRPADRQHRRQRRGPGVRPHLGQRLRRARPEPRPEQLAQHAQRSTTSSTTQGVVGISRRRHPRAHPPPARARRHAGRHLQRRPRRRRRRLRRARCWPAPPMEGADLAHEVTTDEPYVVPAVGEKRFTVAALDLGIKAATPRYMAQRGVEVHVLPATTTGEELLALRARRRLPLQRPGRPGHHRRPGRRHAGGARRRRAAVRHLLRQPDPRPGAGPRHLQAPLRPPRREPAGAGAAHRQGARHQPQPRLRRRRADRRHPVDTPVRPGRGQPRRPQRRRRRGAEPACRPGLQRPVPPGGGARARTTRPACSRSSRD